MATHRTEFLRAFNEEKEKKGANCRLLSSEDVASLIAGLGLFKNTAAGARKRVFEKKQLAKIYEARKKYEVIEIADTALVTSG